MTPVNWKIEGMSCANCVLTIRHYLERQGAQNIKISLAGGDLSFDNDDRQDEQQLQKGIQGLGYTVMTGEEAAGPGEKMFNRYLRYTLICLPFTALLFLPMLDRWLPLPFLMNPWVQAICSLPVYLLGMSFFGRSAWRSLANGLPNMNVLVTLGATAAFVYSLAGTLFHLGAAYQFYETAAGIITLVFFGNYLEDASIQATQRALKELARPQKVMANMIAFDGEHQELIFPVGNTSLRSGDLILIRSGEQVPADCKILWGEGSVDESILSGESLPIDKGPKDGLLGGSLLVSGTVKAQVTAGAKDSVLSVIVNLVKQAQGEKPPVQQLADKISAVFVPVVLILAALTGLLNYYFLHDTTSALMRSIAVLVIACPCAMGLATPAAIAVGLGRAARHGMLFRHARGLESFKDIRQIVFDKTGTLTTGKFRIERIKIMSSEQSVVSGEWSVVSTEEDAEKGEAGKEAMTEEEFKRICYSLAKYSNHPVSKAFTREWKQSGALRWAKIEEVKGLGMRAETKEGDVYWMGSYKVVANLFVNRTPDAAGDFGGRPSAEDTHNSYLLRNGSLMGWVDLADEVRPEAAGVIRHFQSKGIRTILLSGDRPEACILLARQLGIDEVYAGQSPEQKLARISALNAIAPVAMVGDGVNDAPALAAASVGISMSDASHLAMQTADLVLMNQGLKNLPAALRLGKLTFLTIRQNLFWAFFYNVVAIPVAAAGLLSPTLAAGAMGLSDVVLAINSVRLFARRLNQEPVKRETEANF
ncbi:MAG: cation-translocating P-type ATPase [Puia sp.]|nr:cation-translocating P-type ATPase [Puia sp.]